MLKGSKDSLNQHGIIFFIFFLQAEIKSAQKIMF